MNSGPLIFLGALFTLALSYWTVIVGPQMQIGSQKQVKTLVTGEQYPTARTGLAQHGAQVYRANGCQECHTQQVRPPSYSTDNARGWGARRSVVQDYLRDYPVMLGSVRLGPDLANVGSRRTDANWHLKHLYNPQGEVEGSTMPPYRFLFEKRSLASGQKPSADAIGAGIEGYEVVPTDDALALTAYLMSLNADRVSLLEAQLPPKETSETETNSIAAASTQ